MKKEIYHQQTIDIDGKKYICSTGFGYDFLSKHKPGCRKLLSSSDKFNIYLINSRIVKENGIIYDECSNCKRRVIDNTGGIWDDEKKSYDQDKKKLNI